MQSFPEMDVHSGELPIFRQPRFGDYSVGICGEGIGGTEIKLLKIPFKL